MRLYHQLYGGRFLAPHHFLGRLPGNHNQEKKKRGRMQLTDQVYRVKLGSGVASPTSVLVEEELMASWPWEAKPPQTRQGSPLYEGASQAAMRTETRPTLVETLQTCLTSLPHTTMATATSRGQSLMPQLGSGCEDGKVETVDANSMASSRTAQNMTSAPKSAGAGGAKVGKRRSRASRRVPTTVLEANSSDFREMVQKLTGFPLQGIALHSSSFSKLVELFIMTKIRIHHNTDFISVQVS